MYKYELLLSDLLEEFEAWTKKQNWTKPPVEMFYADTNCHEAMQQALEEIEKQFFRVQHHITIEYAVADIGDDEFKEQSLAVAKILRQIDTEKRFCQYRIEDQHKIK